jgi:hypothetical protein
MITIQQARDILNTDKLTIGLGKYVEIMHEVKKINVSTNMNFQKKFNGFYRVRQRTPEFYECYYSFMENNKNNSVSFEETLLHIHEKLHRVEASFSSKLVATIDPDFPIWDTIILENLGFKRPYGKDRLNKTVELYNKIIEWYKIFLASGLGINIIGLFEKKYPDVLISNTKKIDLILWQNRN